MIRKLNTCLFLALIIGVVSCKDQEKSNLSVEIGQDPENASTPLPRLKTTQGSKPGDNVHCGLMDQAGNLWFGTTSEGIYKYDGKSFSQFTEEDGLSSNMVHHLLEDKEGKIWVATSNGVNVFDGTDFSSFEIPLTADRPANSYNDRKDVFSMIQAKSGELWFATIDGVVIYDGDSFTAFQVNEGASGFLSSNNNVEYILEDDSGNFWFGGRGNAGVFRYDGNAITNLKPNGEEWAWPVLQDKNGGIWFSNWNGAYLFDGNSFTSFSKNNGLAGDVVARIIEDRKGNIWIGGEGLARFDGESFSQFSTEDGLQNNSIFSLVEDKDGNIWVGTREVGLSRFDGNFFTSFSERE